MYGGGGGAYSEHEDLCRVHGGPIPYENVLDLQRNSVGAFWELELHEAHVPRANISVK